MPGKQGQCPTRSTHSLVTSHSTSRAHKRPLRQAKLGKNQGLKNACSCLLEKWGWQEARFGPPRRPKLTLLAPKNAEKNPTKAIKMGKRQIDVLSVSSLSLEPISGHFWFFWVFFSALFGAAGQKGPNMQFWSNFQTLENKFELLSGRFWSRSCPSKFDHKFKQKKTHQQKNNNNAKPKRFFLRKETFSGKREENIDSFWPLGCWLFFGQRPVTTTAQKTLQH